MQPVYCYCCCEKTSFQLSQTGSLLCSELFHSHSLKSGQYSFAGDHKTHSKIYSQAKQPGKGFGSRRAWWALGILTLHGGVAHLGWRVVDLQGPLARRPLPPAVHGHELPALEAFIGVVKHPAMVMPHTKKCDFECCILSEKVDGLKSQTEDFRDPHMHIPLHKAPLQLKPARASHLPPKTQENLHHPAKGGCCPAHTHPGSGCSHLLARSCDRVPAGEMRLIWRSPRRGWAMLSRTTTCSRYSTCWSRCSAQALLRVLARSTCSARMYLPGTGNGVRMGTECPWPPGMDALLD